MQLSIITVNLNNFEGLCKTFRSVTSQEWRDYEWIVIDGGSTDGSREFIEQNQRLFTYWCSEPDSGIYNAMNKGLRYAHGEYCLFLNSGDWLCHPDSLNKVFRDGLEFDIECYNMAADQEGKKELFNPLTEESVSADMFIWGSLPHQSSFIRRHLFTEYGGYDETLRIVADWKFFFQAIVFHGATCRFHRSEVLCNIQPAGISRVEVEAREQEREKVISELIPPLILADYNKVKSLNYVLHASWLTRRLYGLLYRLSDFITKNL